MIMKEKLYTIPVNDAFAKDCECPLCAMYKELVNALASARPDRNGPYDR